MPEGGNYDGAAGIVSGIRGNIRYQSIHCIGEAGHSGAVPREYRHDSVFSVANLLVRLDDHWRTLNDHNSDLVLTSGIMSTNQHEHAISRIPGDVSFSFEARSEYPDVLETVESILKSEAQSIERERNVKFEFGSQISSKPALLDKNIIKGFQHSAEKCGLDPFLTPSGAGHDAAIFANEGISTGMLFIRNQHGSHNPQEAMELDDMIVAIDVLYHYLQNH
ncbi:M20/M25/M40 family metallo-hydrolase [Vibrio sp. TH_r3]|uniref:M20/M25/M40 family metallo-hydrolase n=1 Tax=Vibrio sp. TH_r3 TaxID=3082084 RepID=UPI0029553F61|nr:M20/M25/M40 family metallo-hydrolase [Vibrio sp. TH_r3]MDV7105899.1 M20/M25/M40 family metallo-hydrolase [Vibrio sp. TH_r3]